MTDSPSPLTDKTLARLRSLAKGNGLTPDALELVETKEKIFSLKGTLTLTAQSDIASSQSLGRIKGKGIRVHTSFADLQNEVQSLQKSFIEDASWLDKALEELERTKGHGWGQDAAHLSWSDKKIHLAATESCPTCRGTAQHPCAECKGLGTLHCYQCEGRGQELCIHCSGTGQDPLDQNHKCPICHGTRFSVCRFCQGNGKTPCLACQGRGFTPCAACKGTGFISQEVEINQGARLDFTLASTSGLPSGLLRMMSRIGNDKLCDAHADISMTYTPPEEKKVSDHAQIALEAKIPYADIKIKFSGKGALVSVFGKMGKLSGVPPFLDAALSETRKELAQAARGQRSLAGTTEAMRLTREALDLVLSGKTHPNELRRLYPVGLSGETAKEIMTNIVLGLKKDTAHMRLYAGAACVAASTLLFLPFFYLPQLTLFLSGLSASLALGIMALLPLGALGGSWIALSHAAKWSLKRKYPQATIASVQHIGKTGYGTLGLIALIYALLWVL